MALDKIIENHIHAVGGYQAVEDVQRIQIEFHLVEPAFEVDGIYLADRKGCMRVDIYAGNVRVFSEGLDPSQSWQYAQGAEHGTPTSPAGRRALLHGIENQLFGLHELEARGHHLELEGRERLDGVDYDVIKLVYADGDTLWRYINKNNGLIERSRERKALHPDVDSSERIIETLFSDFRRVGMVLRPFQEVQLDLSTEQELQTTLVKSLQINPVLDDKLFACP